MKVILQDEDNELLYDLVANFVAGLSIVKNVSGIYACSYEFNKKIHVDLSIVFDYGLIETQEKINIVSEALKRYVKYLEKKTGIILTVCPVNVLFVTGKSGYTKEDIESKNVLKNSIILYDKKGNLKATQEEYLSNKNMPIYTESISFEPPLTYKIR